MMARHSVFAAFTCAVSAVVLLSWPARAQSPQSSSQTATALPTASAQPVAVAVERLPISMSRLQRRLQASTERQSRDGLNLRYQIDVFGVAPPLVFFTKEDNLTTMAAPYGAPTHSEMVAAMTPRGMAPPPRGRVTRRSRK